MANEKISYEELEQKVQTLEQQVTYFRQQGNTMMGKIRELSDFIAIRRLEFLLKIVELNEKVKWPEDFYTECVDEVVKNMRIPEVEETKEEK